MEALFAPWRASYIERARKNGKDNCMFCAVYNEKSDDSHLIVYRGKHFFVMLNLYPYNPGHVMLVPNRHISYLKDLSDDEWLEEGMLSAKIEKALKITYSPEGMNVGMNLGKASGAGIAEHIHMHFVPRFIGDTNFLPVFAQTKVISEDLGSCLQKLRKHFK